MTQLLQGRPQGSLVLDAEALYRELLRGVRSCASRHAPGGYCLGRRLAGRAPAKGPGPRGPAGVLSSCHAPR
jgi:hypothetical protein